MFPLSCIWEIYNLKTTKKKYTMSWVSCIWERHNLRNAKKETHNVFFLVAGKCKISKIQKKTQEYNKVHSVDPAVLAFSCKFFSIPLTAGGVRSQTGKQRITGL